MKPERPYDRKQFNRALILNALLDSFNVLILAGMLTAGILLNLFTIVLPVAFVVYGIAATRTYLDEGTAAKVLERERAKRRQALERGDQRIDPQTLADPIRKLLEQSLTTETRIRDAIDRAELPYSEVSDEVDGFVQAMSQTALRAQLLFEALQDAPPQQVERRLNKLKWSNDPDSRELIDALEHQLAVQRKIDTQLTRFYREMEQMNVELDTVRGNLISVSASSESSNQRQLADEVRSLREEMGALSEGMSNAFELNE